MSDPATDGDIDALLDADDPTLSRYWRYKALGHTMGQIAALPTNYALHVQLKGEDIRLVKAAARDKGLSMNGYVRTCLARAILADYDLEPPDIPSLARDLGAWAE